jgi:hypothetical protein
VLNRTPESFKTDVAAERPDGGASLLAKGRWIAGRWLEHWRTSRRRQSAERFATDAELQRSDTPLARTKATLRRFADLSFERWNRFARAAASNLSQLDRTLETLQAELQQPDDGASRAKSGRRRFAALLLQGWHLVARVAFSSLSRRIIFLNVTGLLALVIGVLYLSQFRAGLIDARIQSLLVQGEIIASAVAASATVETDSITIDP